MTKLTKEDILEGTRKRITVYLEEYDGKEVIVRPLSDSEVSKIISIIGPLSLSENEKKKDDMNLEIDIHKNIEALRLATEIGIVEPKLTKEEIQSMKFGVPEKIGTIILENSGVSSSPSSSDALKKKIQEIESFVQTQEGRELSILCLDLNYKLANFAGDLTRDQINFLIYSLKLRRQAEETSYLADQGITRIVFNQEG
jgi:hypothetical protein